MNLSDELRKLQELHESGALTAEEFAQAKQTVLAKHSTQTEASNPANLQSKLQEVELQNRLLQLDQQWQADSENYMLRGQNGRYFPTKEGSIVRCILTTGLGFFIALAVVASSSAMAVSSPWLLGIGIFILFVAIALVLSGFEYVKAQEYDRAYWDYQNLRDQMIQRHRDRHKRRP